MCLELYNKRLLTQNFSKISPDGPIRLWSSLQSSSSLNPNVETQRWVATKAMGWKLMLDVEIQPLSLSQTWPQLRFPSPPLTKNITSHSCLFSNTMFCKKNKQATSQVRELFLFRFCLFEAWSFARQKNKKTSRSQLDFPESHCSLVSDAQCDLDWAELDNCVPFPDQYLESEHGPRHREAEDRLDSSKLWHGFL